MEEAHFLPAVSQGIQVLQGEISEVYTCYITCKTLSLSLESHKL